MNAAAIAVMAVLAAVAGGAAAATGWGLPLALLLAALGLVWLGAVLPSNACRGAILAALMLVPDAPSGASFGFDVHWSSGLTWSNFVVPALALPLLAGAFLAGRRLTPVRGSWPGLARWTLLLLAWCLVTLLGPWAQGALSSGATVTLLAHLAKLALFVLLGVVLAGGDERWPRRAGQLLVWAIAVNAAVGLAQAAGWAPVFSPLARAGGVTRATGLFYDANMYGVLMAWALLWLLWSLHQPGRSRRWGWRLLALAVAGNLVAAGSRAGYAALTAGAAVLLLYRCWRPVLTACALLAVLALAFPARSWQRVLAVGEALSAGWTHATVAAPATADTTTEERLASMREAVRQIARHPLLGLGFGRALYLGVAPVASGPVRDANARDFQGAQSMGLTVLAETGPLGLVLFLAAVVDPLRRLRPTVSGPGALPALAGFAGLLVACLTIEALWNTRVLALVVMLTAGVGISATQRRRWPEVST